MTTCGAGKKSSKTRGFQVPETTSLASSLAPACAPAVRLAGYQGEASILTAALRELARSLEVGQTEGEGEGVGERKEASRAWAAPIHVEVDVTARGEMATSLFDSIECGQRQIGYMASSYLSARVPELGVLDLPFSVSDRAAAMAALDGRAGHMLRQAVTLHTGFEVLAFWDNGFRHISNALRPIRSPVDCRSLVIRTLNSAHYRALLEALGFTALSIDVKDLLQSVQTGRVQAQENPLTNLLSFGLWRHHPHLSLTGHLFGVLLLVCPRPWLHSLNAAQRAALDAAVASATQQQRLSAAQEDTRALSELKALGVAVLPPEALDRSALRAACAALCEAQIRALPEALVQAYLQPVTPHRAPGALH